MKQRIKAFINRYDWASRPYWHYVYIRKAISDCKKIRKYVSDTKEYHSSSLARIVWVMITRLWLPDEYVGYGYERMTSRERRDFVLDWEKDAFCRRVDTEKTTSLLNNKMSAYSLLKEYYKRIAVLLNSSMKEEDKSTIICLYDKGLPLIVKPIASGGGKGIRKVDPKEYDNCTSFINGLMREYPKGCVIEELIVQDERMAVLHPQSINTVRMSTIRRNGKVELFHPFMRVGCGDSVVDNGGSGGLLMPFDIQNGKILCAANELGKSYEFHPDTEIRLIGFTIPRWGEAVALINDIMALFPNDSYISWDLALTESGWIVVEGNSHGQFAGQYALHRGIRDDFEVIKRDIYKEKKHKS